MRPTRSAPTEIDPTEIDLPAIELPEIRLVPGGAWADLLDAGAQAGETLDGEAPDGEEPGSREGAGQDAGTGPGTDVPGAVVLVAGPSGPGARAL